MASTDLEAAVFACDILAGISVARTHAHIHTHTHTCAHAHTHAHTHTKRE